MNTFDLRDTEYEDLLSQMVEIVKASKSGSRITNLLPLKLPDMNDSNGF